MTISGFGIALTALGTALVIGTGVPQRGFWKLLKQCNQAIKEGKKPTLDQSYARTMFWFYVAGAAMIAVGISCYLFGIVFEGGINV